MLTHEKRHSLVKATLSNLFKLQQDFIQEAKGEPEGSAAQTKAEFAASCAYQARVQAGWVEDRILKQMGIREDKF